MVRKDIHVPYDFFEFAVANGSEPKADARSIDVALLDMHHGWPNVGHDSLVHAILEVAEESREELVSSGSKVRVVSYDVRRQLLIPESGPRFALYVGTGGPGHLDPRYNDGLSEFSQGIRESSAWETPLFKLFDAILERPDAALIAVCHSFGLMCRWGGFARPQLRPQKSSGVPVNALSQAGSRHPWFSRFAERLDDGRHFRVVDNRLFDLVVEDTSSSDYLAFDDDGSAALTMIELARDAESGMPRILGMNHHPEIIDRAHVMAVLEEKREHHDVSETWYEERVTTMRDLFRGEIERQSRLTSEYTLLAPLRHHIRRAIGERCGSPLPQAVQ
jgi:hypothetical protein